MIVESNFLRFHMLLLIRILIFILIDVDLTHLGQDKLKLIKDLFKLLARLVQIVGFGHLSVHQILLPHD